MKPTMLQKWLDALRSGKYKQGKGSLCQKPGPRAQPRYCCLGVLAELNGDFDDKWECNGPFYDKGKWVKNFAGEDNQDGFLGKYYKNRHGYRRQRAMYVPQHHQDTLAALNDDGESFKDIADYIEENVDKLYKGMVPVGKD